jgi:hypothetical protein
VALGGAFFGLQVGSSAFAVNRIASNADGGTGDTYHGVIDTALTGTSFSVTCR